MKLNKENFRLYGVLSTGLDEVWPEVAPMIQRSVDFSDGRYSVENIYENIKKQNMQLWVAYQDSGLTAICVTQIICYPLQKRLGILFSAGVDLDGWIDFIEPILFWGKNMGCECAEIFGRPGWEKKLKSHGFSKVQVILKAQLKEI